MSDKYYINKEDIQAIADAVEVLRSADFNAIHDNLEVLSGINSGKNIEVGSLLTSVQQLQNTIEERQKQVAKAISEGNKSANLRQYHSDIEDVLKGGKLGKLGLDAIVKKMEGSVKATSKRKIDGTELFDAVRKGMGKQFAYLSSSSVENPNKQVKMFLEKGISMIQNHIGKGIMHDNKKYSHDINPTELFKGEWEELYSILGSGNFGRLQQYSNTEGVANKQYIKIAQDIIHQIESGIGHDASAFKKDMALTSMAKTLGVKNIQTFERAFSNAALNGGEKVAAEVKANMRNFLLQNLTEAEYNRVMSEVISGLTFADGDTLSRDRIIKEASERVGKMIGKDTRDIFEKIPTFEGAGSSSSKPIKNANLRKTAIDSAVQMVNEQIVDVGSLLSEHGQFKTHDWFSGKISQQRYKTLEKASGTKGVKFNTYSKSALDTMQKAAANYGMTLVPSISPDGSQLHVGLVKKGQEKDILKKDGTIDFGKTAGHIQLPIGNKNGSMVINGMSTADFFTSFVDNGNIVNTTLSELYMKQFADAFTGINFANMNPREMSYRLGKIFQDIYGGSANLNTRVDSDEMIKGTTLGPNAGANLNKSSGFDARPLINGLKKTPEFSKATKGMDIEEVNQILHDLITYTSSAAGDEYEEFIKSVPWLNNLYGTSSNPGIARDLIRQIREQTSGLGLTSKDRRDDPYNAGIYSTALSHILKPFMKEYGSGEGARYGEQSTKTIAKTQQAIKQIEQHGIENGMLRNKIKHGLAHESNVGYNNDYLYTLMGVTDKELSDAAKELGLNGVAPSVREGGLAIKSDLYDTLDAERPIPISVSREDFLESAFYNNIFTESDKKDILNMKENDYFNSPLDHSGILSRGYKLGNRRLQMGSQFKGIRYSNGEYIIDAIENIAAGEGEKYLAGFGLRGTLAPGDIGVTNDLIKKVLELKGFSSLEIDRLAPQISGFTSINDMAKSKYIPGEVLGTVQYAFNKAMNDGMTISDMRTRLESLSESQYGDLGQVLSKYFSITDSGDIITSKDIDEIMTEVTGGDIGKIRGIESKLFERGSASGGLIDVLTKVFGDNAALASGLKAGLISTSIGKADTSTYEGIGNKVKAGARERDIFKRLRANLTSSDSIDKDSINAYFNALEEVMSPKNQEEVERKIARMKKISSSTWASGSRDTSASIKGDTFLNIPETSRAIFNAGNISGETPWEISNRREHGGKGYTITKDEYNKSIFGELERIRESVFNGGGFVNKEDIALSAKLPSKIDMGDGYAVDEVFLSALPQMIDDEYILTDEQRAFEKIVRNAALKGQDLNEWTEKNARSDIESLLKHQNASYMGKRGDLFRERNEAIQFGAGFLKASAGNVEYGDESAKQSNLIEVSADTMRDVLGSMDQKTLSQLANYFNGKTGAGKIKTAEDILNYMLKSGAHIIGEGKRFPLEGDNTITPTRIRVSENLHGDTMRMHSGISSILKADFDGDLPVLSTSLLQKTYETQEEFDKAMAGGEQAVNALDEIVYAVGRYNSQNQIKSFGTGEDYMKSLTKTENKEAVGAFSKKLKTSLGLHSAAFSGIRHALDTAVDSKSGSSEAKMQRMLINSMMQSVVQNLLSNKKFEEINSNTNLTDEQKEAAIRELAMDQSNLLNEVQSLLFNKNSKVKDLQGKWQQMGFTTDKDGKIGLGDQFTLDALMRIKQLYGSEGAAFLEKIGVNPETIFKKGTEVKSDEFNPFVSFDSFADIYHDLMGSSNFGEHAVKYREAIGKTVTEASAVREAKFGANIYGVGSGVAKSADEATASINALAQVLQALIPGGNAASDAIKQVSANLQGLSNIGKMQATKSNNGGVRVTDLANQMLGNIYTGDATEKVLNNLIDDYVLSEHAVDSYGNKSGTSDPVMAELAKEKFIRAAEAQGDQWLKYRDAIQHTRYGTFQHSALEAVTGAQADLNGLSDSSEIKNFLKNKDIDLSTVDGLNQFRNMNFDGEPNLPTGLNTFKDMVGSRYDNYIMQESVYRGVMQLLGFTDDTINESVSRTKNVTSKVSELLESMGWKPVAVEEAYGASVDGRNIKGRSDLIVEDENGNRVNLDYKNSDKVSDASVVQSATYGEMDNAKREALVNEVLKRDQSGATNIGQIPEEKLDGILARLVEEDGIYKGTTVANLKSLLRSESTSSGVIQIDSGENVNLFGNTVGGENFKQMISKILSGNATPEEIAMNKKLMSAYSALAKIFGIEGGEGALSSNAERHKKDQTVSASDIEKQQKQAMQRSIKSQQAYDNAELNMLRAQKALEKARASGNAQAIYGAEQQLEGARSQAAIASQYRSQFGAVDANGNVIKTTDANGRPLSLQQLQQAGVDVGNMRGITRVWDADLGDWKDVELSAAQTKQHVTDIAMQWSKQQQAIGKVGTQVKTVGSLIGEVFGGLKQTVEYLMRTSIVYAIIGKVKQAFATLIQTTQALNKSYVDLRIASGQTDSQMKDSMKVYNQMAKEMGKTTQEVANAANDWLRAGYNAEESAKLIKNSMQLSTVGMIDSAKATEYLISTMKGWKLGVDDMEGVVDKLAEIDRHAAISSGDLAESMSRANVSAQLAGSSLNKYMSYLTTVSDVSQLAPESVGTA